MVGHKKHCPGKAYETADNPKQHSTKDMGWSLTASPSQPVMLKQTGAVKCNYVYMWPKINNREFIA